MDTQRGPATRNGPDGAGPLLAAGAPAQNDAGHPYLLMLSDPGIPDRTDGICGTLQVIMIIIKRTCTLRA